MVVHEVDHLILPVFLLYDIQSSQETLQNLGLAAVFHCLCFWVYRNLIYLMTVLSNLPSILCAFLVDEEIFANCMHGMQSAGSLLTRKRALDCTALSSAVTVRLCKEILIFFLAYMNNE